MIDHDRSCLYVIDAFVGTVLPHSCHGMGAFFVERAPCCIAGTYPKHSQDVPDI